MEFENELKEALKELRKEENKRKFNQTVDLIINLQKYDHKRNPVNLFISLPHKIKDKKICGFLEVKNDKIDTITKNDFKKYSDKKELKKLVKKYDFFIAQGSLMANVATTFGKVLGPAGKMPSPQLGILMNVDEKEISNLKERINNSIKLRTKEASVKLAIGKEDMKDEEIIENISQVYGSLTKALQRGKDNVKNLEVKFTMTKPVKIKLR
ncbi:MAG: hypothetical protein WDZ77_00465 [Candidatus Pacearchaeota archaeon]